MGYSLQIHIYIDNADYFLQNLTLDMMICTSYYEISRGNVSSRKRTYFMGRANKVLQDAIRHIHTMFKKRDKIPAREFYSSVKGSRLTVLRAKKAMKIRSARYRDPDSQRFIVYWYRGEQPLEKILAEIEKVKKKRVREKKDSFLRNHGVADECQLYVRDFMTAEGTGYEVKGTQLIEALREIYTRRTIVKAKQALGIVSIKRKDGWYWLWPAQEVQDWLENLLIDTAPLPKERIYDMARDKGWSPDTVNLAREKLGRGEIQEVWNDSEWCWYSPRTGAIPQKWRNK
jgi:hypothetical protein